MALDALAMTAFASWPVAVSVSNAINATKVTRNFFDIESSPMVSCRLESVYCETYHLPRSAEIVHDVVDHERLAGIEIVSGGGKTVQTATVRRRGLVFLMFAAAALPLQPLEQGGGSRRRAERRNVVCFPSLMPRWRVVRATKPEAPQCFRAVLVLDVDAEPGMRGC